MSRAKGIHAGEPYLLALIILDKDRGPDLVAEHEIPPARLGVGVDIVVVQEQQRNQRQRVGVHVKAQPARFVDLGG